MNCCNTFFLILMSVLFCKVFGSNNNNNFKGSIPCDSQKDCDELENAKCEEGLCKCAAVHNLCEEKNQRYVNKIGYGCNATNECNMENSKCGLNNRCICVEDMVPSEDKRKCLKMSDGIGGRCEENSQCYTRTPSTICQANKCVCQEHMHTFNGACYRKIELGHQCSLNEECLHLKLSECKNSKCKCISNHTFNGLECIPFLNSTALCQNSTECKVILGIGSHCIVGICECREEYHFNKKLQKCVKSAFLNDLCENHDDCHQPGQESSRLECILGVCECKTGYLEEEGYCISAAVKSYLYGNSQILFVLLIIYEVFNYCLF